ncbi:MAG TPA: SAM-dependent methyltransferase [Micavibrio sp.]
MAKHAKTAEFLDSLSAALEGDQFVKLSLGHYKGEEEGLKQVIARRIMVKRAPVLSFTYRYKTRDIVKNYPLPEAQARIATLLHYDFLTATLQTTAADIALDLSKNTLQKKAVVREAVSYDHDRAKNRAVSAQAPWLSLLGITDHQGQVKKDAQDKFRQIDKYIETLNAQLKHIDMASGVRVADMGAGKGYLTFALYDHLVHKLGVKAEIVGVEYRQDLVDFCNQAAQTCGYEGLRFVQGTIADYKPGALDVLIALHACDTATDDAIAQGVKAGAQLIVVAPCCHKQIRREMEAHRAKTPLDFLLRHGTFMERQAEMVTDGLRALMLEYQGYSAQIFEFISDAHTPKNVMIAAVKTTKNSVHDPALLQKIKTTKDYFGIARHHLEKILEI